MECAQFIYGKIDRDGVGYIDRDMLKDYCRRIISFVEPGGHVDEPDFENGFMRLDSDGDGKVTFSDILTFVKAKYDVPFHIPPSFMAYAKATKP